MLKILKPGAFSTIQDSGRFGYRAQGVIVSGAMDRVAFRLGNALLQQKNKATIEMTLIGGDFLFTKPTTIALTGGVMQAKLNGQVIPMNTAIPICANDELQCGPIVQRARSYLCIAGGFVVPPVLHSASTYIKAGFGGFHGRALQRGDEVAYVEHTKRIPIQRVNSTAFYKERPIRVLAGTEWEHFTNDMQQQFLQQPYTISLEADRMGYRLQGQVAIETTFQLLSEAVTFGTIQVPASGQPIILMADHQTTGGYPKIAQVISADLPRLAQLPPNNVITFELVSLQQAEQAALTLEQQLRLLEILLAQ